MMYGVAGELKHGMHGEYSLLDCYNIPLKNGQKIFY